MRHPHWPQSCTLLSAYAARHGHAGTCLAFTAHASCVGIISGLDPSQTTAEAWQASCSVRLEVLQHLPMRAISFLAQNRVVVAGFDGVPVLLVQQQDGTWTSVDVRPGDPHSVMGGCLSYLSASNACDLHTWPKKIVKQRKEE